MLEYLKTRKGQCSVDRATTDALRNWLLAQAGRAPVGPDMRGYQWKMLFLPGWDLPERRKYRIRLEDFE